MINPMQRRTITSAKVQSGSCNGSAMIETSSRITKEAAAYTVITRTTFLRFSSCQNYPKLLNLPGICSKGIGLRYIKMPYPNTKYLCLCKQIDLITSSGIAMVASDIKGWQSMDMPHNRFSRRSYAVICAVTKKQTA